MKKNLLGWLAMATMLVGIGCSSDEVVNDYSPENAIQFGTYVGRDAQGRVANTTLTTLKTPGFGFGVFANYNQDSETGDKPNFMNNQPVTWTGQNTETGSWTYSPVKYWPNNQEANVSFWAYAPYDIENHDVDATTPWFKIHDGIDYVATERKISGKQAVDGTVLLAFNHVMSRVGFKVEAVIDEVLELLDKNKKDTVTILKKMDKPVTDYLCNRDRLKELILNLADNGIKYTNEGQVVITCWEEEKDLVFQFSDTGVGIPEEHLPRLFERFYRVDKGRSRKQGGTGLGLSIVKHIVELYKGSISVESRVGEGSVFTVRLPYYLDK